MNETVLIVSLKFRAAHISHLIASYHQMEDLGYHPILWVAKECVEFLPLNIDYVLSINEIKDVSIAIFWFPAIGNFKAMWKLKYLFHAKIIYVFHEPAESFSTYLKSGNSLLWTIIYFAKYYVTLSFLALSDKVILPSNKAVNLYRKGLSRFANKRFSYLPLLYDDERTVANKNSNRIYISYIGGISKDHAFDEFVNYIYEAYRINEFPGVKFLIASWQRVDISPKMHEMIDSGILDIHDGRPMTNEEINDFYAKTYVVWNAYNRTTQSGVLAKSFMFGTPALVTCKNLSEFISDGKEIKAVDSNTDYEELTKGIRSILSDFNSFSENARKNFERNYLYSTHNKEMADIIDNL